jgi:hypothetical protein
MLLIEILFFVFPHKIRMSSIVQNPEKRIKQAKIYSPPAGRKTPVPQPPAVRNALTERGKAINK